MAPPIADRLLSPLVFQGVKLPTLMNSSPTVAIRASGMNLSTVLQSWKTPMLRTPVRLTIAGIHSPTSAIAIEPIVLPPLLRNSCT